MLSMTTKSDLKKTLDAYQAKKGQFRILEVPPMAYLMIDGHGDPNSVPAFAESIESLYPVAYTLKFTSKTVLDRDYTVMPLEGLWWADDHASFTTARDKSQWRWTLMIMQPEWVDAEMFADAVAKVRAKGRGPRLDEVRFGSLSEGLCVQTLHIGAFDDEADVLAQLHDEYLPANDLRPTGRHHEIYFSDPRRGAPEKRRTILRQPVEAIS